MTLIKRKNIPHLVIMNESEKDKLIYPFICIETKIIIINRNKSITKDKDLSIIINVVYVNL